MDNPHGGSHEAVAVRHLEDVEAIHSVLRHPDVFHPSCDDFCGGPLDLDFGPVLSSRPDIGCIGAYAAGQLIGLFVLIARSPILWEVHTGILPEHRAAHGAAAARALIHFLFSQTSCRKLITLVPEFNRPALVYAMRAGLRKEGVLTASFLKGGVLHDQTLLSINKEQLCP